MSAALEQKQKDGAAPATAPQGESEGVRRSQRLITSQTEVSRLRADLDQCRAELLAKSQGKDRFDRTDARETANVR